MLSCICQFCVLRSFSPKDSAAFCRAERRVSTFCRCASISLFSTVFRAESACTELSFLSNCEDTSFISEPRTLKDWLISASAFLNSFSPSTPIRNPKSSAMRLPPPYAEFEARRKAIAFPQKNVIMNTLISLQVISPLFDS